MRRGLLIGGASISLIIFLISLFMSWFLPWFVNRKIKQELSLGPNSVMLQKWSKIELPIYLSVYLFEVTNPDQVEDEGAKPVLKERGPYTFLETKWKNIIGFEEENQVIKYKELTVFHFVPEKSNGNLDDEMTVLNIPVVVRAMAMTTKVNSCPQAAVNNAFQEVKSSDMGEVMIDILKSEIEGLEEKLFDYRTVGQILFQGYKVELFDRLVEMAKGFGMEVKESLPNNTFGLFVTKNNSDNGLWSVETGLGDTQTFKVRTWNESAKLSFYSEDKCNAIRGTDGSGFHSGVQRTDVLHLFHPDLCRSAYITYHSDNSIHGVPTYRFIIPNKIFSAPLNDPENSCFCTQPESDQKLCTINGIQDMSACSQGAPIVTSSPHFFGADPFLREEVSGLKPEEGRHRAFIDIEPITGAVVNAFRRLQLNVVIKERPDFPPFKHVKDMILPVAWIEETASINEEMAANFKSINTVLNTGNITFKSLMAITFLLAVLCFAFLHTYPTQKTSPLRTKQQKQVLIPKY